MRPTALRDVEADLELLGATLDEVCHAGGAGETLSLRDAGCRACTVAHARVMPRPAMRCEHLIAELDLDAIELLIRSLTRWFQLINLAEDNERVRRIRAREERRMAGAAPWLDRRGHRGDGKRGIVSRDGA